MNLTSKYPIMIFRNEHEGKVFYKMGVSKKDKEGNYINGYIDCKFKKDVDVPNKTKIIVERAWLDFYNTDKKTIPVVFISDFVTEEDKLNNPFMDFGEAVELDDNFLD